MGASPALTHWLALILAPGLGTRRFAQLNEHFGSGLGWVNQPDAALRQAGLNETQIRALRQPEPDALKRCLRWLDGDRHHLVTLDDDYYPPLLREIPDPPPALFVAGQRDCLLQPQLAIVGSRNATPGGLEHARSFAATLARAGLVITSGLAAGIDGAAHQASLRAGGKTVAVAGTGLDRVYPARHRDLARDIVQNGALVSTFPPGVEPRPGNFPARNRVISGMALGTLVIEAGQRSGSLITARLAAEQGREIFAVPGSVHNPLARGCHRLIREGGKLVETAEDVLEDLQPLARQLGLALAERLAREPDQQQEGQLDSAANPPHVQLDRDYQHLLDTVGYDPTPVDEIIARSQLTTAAVSSMLLMLELDGYIAAHAGGRYSRTNKDSE